MLRRNVPMTIFLFLIMTLHTTTLGCFQWPHSFIWKELAPHPIFYKCIFYATALIVSVLHLPISRRIGIKMELVAGVLSSATGMLLFILHANLFPESSWTLIPSMILMGFSMLSVINCLLTYVILVFSNKTLLGIIALFAFGNAGMMFAPQLLRLGIYLHLTTELLFCIVAFLLMYGAGILILFDEPSYAADPSLQANTYLKKEMPLRFPLYLWAASCYGLVESAYSLWGEGLVARTISLGLSRISASSFWLSMVLGQVLLLFLVQRFNPRKCTLVMNAMMLAALLWLSNAFAFWDILVGIIVGGLGCSAIFSITLFFLMREIFFFSHMNRDRYLTLIENGVSWMTASYLWSIAVNDLAIDWLDSYSRLPFLIAIAYLFLYVAIMFYLNKTRPIDQEHAQNPLAPK